MGQTHGKRGSGIDADDPYGRGPSPMSPGSPLTYSAQPPSEKGAEDSRGTAEFHGVAAWPAEPKLVPVVIVWSHGGNHVEVEGSFDNWTTRVPLQRSGKDFTIVKLLLPGVYQYKFIVDGEWRYDPNQTAMYDEMGNVNNVIEVQEYVPENLEGVSGFDPPPSPPSSYNNPAPVAEDYQKEPVTLPPHLQLTLLNVPPAADHQAALPRPQHIILNHVYCQRGHNMNCLVVGVTHRYKSKYITTIMYKPKVSRKSSKQQQH